LSASNTGKSRSRDGMVTPFSSGQSLRGLETGLS
jgi:hypothetical protein